MILNMRNVLTRSQRPQFTERLDVSHLFDDRADMAAVSELDIDLQAVAAGDAVEVSGSLKLQLRMVCSRCLNETFLNLHIPFLEKFVHTDEDADSEWNDDMQMVTQDKVDLVPIIEENVLLAVPYVPLCAEECKGLCPVCGTNRNDHDCGCKSERIDPRLAPLADLFAKQEG